MITRQLFIIIDAILLIVILFSFLGFIKETSNDDLYKQKFTSIDIALLYDTVQASPSNVEVNYTIKDFDVRISDKCQFQVSKKSTFGELWSEFYCSKDLSLEHSFNIEQDKDLVILKKQDNKLIIN